jgi:NAD(P)-dependent dehydrogenase (short-subunit alcohol dehydrogenase family)
MRDKVVLVTGSSRGIGAAIATLFAERGAKVAIHGRDTAALESVRAKIESAGGRVIRCVADVTRFADVEAMRREVEERLGPVDVLVANAGASLTPPGPLEEISADAWRASVDVNLTATFLCIKSILPGMKERRAGNQRRIPPEQQTALAGASAQTSRLPGRRRPGRALSRLRGRRLDHRRHPRRRGWRNHGPLRA